MSFQAIKESNEMTPEELDGSSGSIVDIEAKMWQFADKYGSFTLDFGPTAYLGMRDATFGASDYMPWTLNFCKESGETAEWDHHFGGFNLPDLFDWAAEFIEGRSPASGGGDKC